MVKKKIMKFIQIKKLLLTNNFVENIRIFNEH